ncbi:MAG: hypothetical protein ABJ056_03780, partial [Halioglobus sp.]
MPSMRSAQEEQDSPSEVEALTCQVKLAMENSEASMLNAMRETMAEFTRNNGRSESGSAEVLHGMLQHIKRQICVRAPRQIWEQLDAEELRCLSRLAHRGVSQTSMG